MTFPENLGLPDVTQYWVTRGPNSGGIEGWLLYDSHVFSFLHDGAFTVGDGVPAKVWLEAHSSAEPKIAAAVQELL